MATYGLGGAVVSCPPDSFARPLVRPPSYLLSPAEIRPRQSDSSCPPSRVAGARAQTGPARGTQLTVAGGGGKVQAGWGRELADSGVRVAKLRRPEDACPFHMRRSASLRSHDAWTLQQLPHTTVPSPASLLIRWKDDRCVVGDRLHRTLPHLSGSRQLRGRTSVFRATTHVQRRWQSESTRGPAAQPRSTRHGRVDIPARCRPRTSADKRCQVNLLNFENGKDGQSVVRS